MSFLIINVNANTNSADAMASSPAPSQEIEVVTVNNFVDDNNAPRKLEKKQHSSSWSSSFKAALACCFGRPGKSDQAKEKPYEQVETSKPATIRPDDEVIHIDFTWSAAAPTRRPSLPSRLWAALVSIFGKTSKPPHQHGQSPTSVSQPPAETAAKAAPPVDPPNGEVTGEGTGEVTVAESYTGDKPSGQCAEAEAAGLAQPQQMSETVQEVVQFKDIVVSALRNKKLFSIPGSVHAAAPDGLSFIIQTEDKQRYIPSRISTAASIAASRLERALIFSITEAQQAQFNAITLTQQQRTLLFKGILETAERSIGAFKKRLRSEIRDELRGLKEREINEICKHGLSYGMANTIDYMFPLNLPVASAQTNDSLHGLLGEHQLDMALIKGAFNQVNEQLHWVELNNRKLPEDIESEIISEFVAQLVKINLLASKDVSRGTLATNANPVIENEAVFIFATTIQPFLPVAEWATGNALSRHEKIRQALTRLLSIIDMQPDDQYGIPIYEAIRWGISRGRVLALGALAKKG